VSDEVSNHQHSCYSQPAGPDSTTSTPILHALESRGITWANCFQSMDYSRDLTGALLRIALWRRAEWKTDVHPGIRETLDQSLTLDREAFIER